MRIRAPGALDAPRLAELANQLGYPALPGDVGSRLERLGEAPTHCIRLAEDRDGSILGWIHAAEQDSLESGRRCEILGLVVDETRRRQGIGRALVGGVEEWAGARGLTSISVRTNVTRADAPAFYEALGYHQAKTQLVYRRSLP